MKRVPTLDGWRAVAVTAVALHHLARCFYPHEADYAQSITRFGAFGVDIFFGLSGLLITKLLLQEWRKSGCFDLRGFYIRRAFRILPPYLMLLAVFTAAGLWRSKLEALSCLLFFRNYAPDPAVNEGTQHLWSLAVEEHFYLFWPGLLAWIGVRRSKSAAIGLALGVAVWRMIDSQLPAPLLPLLPQHFRTDLRLDALLWGCAVAFLLEDEAERARLAKQLRFGAWVTAAGIVGLSIAIYSPLSSVFVAVLIPILLAGTATNPEWLLSRALELAPVTWLGRISYSWYLWQQLFLMPGWAHPTHWWQRWPENLPASLAVAALSYYCLEKPLLAVGRDLAQRSGRSSIQALSAQTS